MTRFSRVAAVAMLVIAGYLSPIQLPAPAVAAGPVPACLAEAADAREALKMAARCGTDVEALSERTEYTQVKINPSGVATLVSAVTPQRVRRADGSWSAVDPTLRRDADGSLVPAATMATVRFSGGGTGPMVTWRESGSTFTVSWPGVPLPAPRPAGDTAVYEAVLPGVDLHVTATVDGFTYALAVKTRAAAANPALRQLRFAIGGNAQLRNRADGGLDVVDAAGRLFASSPGAAMWDSSVRATSPGALRVSSARAPGTSAVRAPVALTSTGTELVLTPDAGMLADPAAKLPIFIDPPFNRAAAKWVYATNNGENNDASNARVGRRPDTGALYRSYFQFDTVPLKNTNVLSAHIKMELDHSYSCAATWVTLFRVAATSAANNSRIPWSGSGSRPLGAAAPKIDAWQGNAHEGAPCDQPNVPVIFDQSTVRADIDAANTDTYTVGLCACSDTGANEADEGRWKHFVLGKTFLVATYDLPPWKPTGQPFLTTADCYLQCASPAIVRTTTPTLRMGVQDPFGGTLLTAVEIRTAALDTAPIVVDSATFRFTTSTQAVTNPGESPPVVASIQVPAGKLTNGGTYFWRANTRDENNQWSGLGAWQSFTVDTVAPASPAVSSTEYPDRQWGAPVGTAGTFTLTGDASTARFTWQVDAGPVTTLTPSGTTTTTATTDPYTPSTDMVHTLFATAKDIAGNTSATYSHQLWVAPAPNRCWNWRLDETSGTTAADSGNTDANDPVCTPIGPSVTSMPGALSGGVAWASDPVRGRVATFDGTGEITATSAVLDNTKAFTVAAWVNFSNLAASNRQTVIAQAGANLSRFELQYDGTANGGTGGFCFVMHQDQTTAARACAPQSSHPVTQGQWVHLAGVYNPAAGTIRVFVMGDVQTCGGDQGEAPFSAPYPASGSKFLIGHAALSSPTQGPAWLVGSVDKVYAHQRALANIEICQMSLQ